MDTGAPADRQQPPRPRQEARRPGRERLPVGRGGRDGPLSQARLFRADDCILQKAFANNTILVYENNL